MYILLTGRSTFYGESYLEILNKNKKCIINFDFKELGCKFSKNAEELLKLMLKRNPKERVTVKQALQHPWFKEKSVSLMTQIHHEAMQKLLQQQQQFMKTTKPQDITDSQNVIQNSPIINGSTMSQKNSPNASKSPGSPSQIISPLLLPQKKSKFAGMHENIQKINNQKEYNVADLKSKIQSPSKNHKSLKAYQQQQKKN
eukprot:TRINITY_DN9197_c0_g1_i1.p1 TRINITY_DN9197_c0_g1~~TRINITY_DN9197_c0_g1_i1.p1  ORF type:complete len:200 (+),score=33.09 TRINITY_DN9197_c0_g1_i1:960-1559(+)